MELDGFEAMETVFAIPPEILGSFTIFSVCSSGIPMAILFETQEYLFGIVEEIYNGITHFQYNYNTIAELSEELSKEFLKKFDKNCLRHSQRY